MWPELVAGATAGFASIPHCTAMCGPLAAYACSSPQSGVVRYHSGRLIAYAGVGIVAGSLGSLVAANTPGRWGAALLSWSLAIGLGLAALRLWRRPRERLVRLRVADERNATARPSAVQRVRDVLLGRPFLIGAATALLPCGALAAAVLIAASAGTAYGGAIAMLSFAVASAVGLLGAGWLFAHLRTRPSRSGVSRALAVVLALGAVMFVIRPLSTLRYSEPSSDVPVCHAPGAARTMIVEVPREPR